MTVVFNEAFIWIVHQGGEVVLILFFLRTISASVVALWVCQNTWSVIEFSIVLSLVLSCSVEELTYYFGQKPCNVI